MTFTSTLQLNMKRIGKIDRINPALIRYLIEKCNACGIGMHDNSNVGRN